MSLPEYILLAASSLFVIVDPLAVVPAFLAMTPTDSPEQRIRMARLACCVMAGVLIVFAIAGKWIFKFLGITMPAFQIAASNVRGYRKPPRKLPPALKKPTSQWLPSQSRCWLAQGPFRLLFCSRTGR